MNNYNKYIMACHAHIGDQAVQDNLTFIDHDI